MVCNVCSFVTRLLLIRYVLSMVIIRSTMYSVAAEVVETPEPSCAQPELRGDFQQPCGSTECSSGGGGTCPSSCGVKMSQAASWHNRKDASRLASLSLPFCSSYNLSHFRVSAFNFSADITAQLEQLLDLDCTARLESSSLWRQFAVSPSCKTTSSSHDDGGSCGWSDWPLCGERTEAPSRCRRDSCCECERRYRAWLCSTLLADELLQPPCETFCADLIANCPFLQPQHDYVGQSSFTCDLPRQESSCFKYNSDEIIEVRGASSQAISLLWFTVALLVFSIWKSNY